MKTGGFRKPGRFSLTKNGWSPKPCGDDCGKRNNPSYINIPFASTLVTPKQTISDGSKWWNLPIFHVYFMKNGVIQLKHPHQEQNSMDVCCIFTLLAPVPSIQNSCTKRLHFLLAIVAIMARNIHIITLVLGRRFFSGKIGRNPRPSGGNLPKKRSWNAKCPIFLGNFTPKTSNYCLKDRALGFPGWCIWYTPRKLTNWYPKWWFRKGGSFWIWSFLISMLNFWRVYLWCFLQGWSIHIFVVILIQQKILLITFWSMVKLIYLCFHEQAKSKGPHIFFQNLTKKDGRSGQSPKKIVDWWILHSRCGHVSFFGCM